MMLPGHNYYYFYVLNIINNYIYILLKSLDCINNNLD